MPERVLILANEFITNGYRSFPKAMRQQTGHTRELFVVAPILTTRLQSLTSDTDDARQAAQQRLDRIAADMGDFRSPPLTAVGDENQLLAVADALATFDADACVVVAHSWEHANYHEHGVSEQIQEQFKLPTTTLTVDTNGHIVGYQTA